MGVKAVVDVPLDWLCGSMQSNISDMGQNTRCCNSQLSLGIQISGQNFTSVLLNNTSLRARMAISYMQCIFAYTRPLCVVSSSICYCLASLVDLYVDSV